MSKSHNLFECSLQQLMGKAGRHQGLMLEFHELRSNMGTVHNIYLPSCPPSPRSLPLVATCGSGVDRAKRVEPVDHISARFNTNVPSLRNFVSAEGSTKR